MQMPIRLPEVHIIMCGKPHARAKDFPLRNARPAVTWSVLRTLGFGFGTPRAISPTDRANAIAGLVLIAASVHSFQSPTRTRIRDTKELAWFTSALHSPSSSTQPRRRVPFCVSRFPVIRNLNSNPELCCDRSKLGDWFGGEQTARQARPSSKKARNFRMSNRRVRWNFNPAACD